MPNVTQLFPDSIRRVLLPVVAVAQVVALALLSEYPGESWARLAAAVTTGLFSLALLNHATSGGDGNGTAALVPLVILPLALFALSGCAGLSRFARDLGECALETAAPTVVDAAQRLLAAAAVSGDSAKQEAATLGVSLGADAARCAVAAALAELRRCADPDRVPAAPCPVEVGEEIARLETLEVEQR